MWSSLWRLLDTFQQATAAAATAASESRRVKRVSGASGHAEANVPLGEETPSRNAVNARTQALLDDQNIRGRRK